MKEEGGKGVVLHLQQSGVRQASGESGRGVYGVHPQQPEGPDAAALFFRQADGGHRRHDGLVL